MAYETLKYEVREAVAWITFNRPAAMNAISIPLIHELRQVINEVKSDGSVRVVVLTGTGRAFCAGADLKASLALKETEGRMATVTHFLIPLQEALRELRQLPKPVIAAVNGYCMAGGLETVLVCDIIVAAESAEFSDAHARYGLLPAIGGAWGLTRALGPYKAKEVMFTADHYSAQQMQQAGLVCRVVPDASLLAEADKLATQLAERSAEDLARMKQMVNDEIEMPWDLAARYELSMHANNTAMSKDLMEGLRAFSEKRAPAF
jgi:enoyl-CoA hydratase